MDFPQRPFITIHTAKAIICVYFPSLWRPAAAATTVVFHAKRFSLTAPAQRPAPPTLLMLTPTTHVLLLLDQREA